MMQASDLHKQPSTVYKPLTCGFSPDPGGSDIHVLMFSLPPGLEEVSP